jgi:hypothetical protein
VVRRRPDDAAGGDWDFNLELSLNLKRFIRNKEKRIPNKFSSFCWATLNLTVHSSSPLYYFKLYKNNSQLPTTLNHNLQQKLTIAIYNYILQLLFTTTTYNCYSQLQLTIPIYNYHLQLQFTTTAFNDNFQLNNTALKTTHN